MHCTNVSVELSPSPPAVSNVGRCVLTAGLRVTGMRSSHVSKLLLTSESSCTMYCYHDGTGRITKDSYGRGAGTIPSFGCDPCSWSSCLCTCNCHQSCPSGQEEDAGLCYPRCNPGYTGVGPVCWGTCPSGYTVRVDCFKYDELEGSSSSSVIVTIPNPSGVVPCTP